MLRALMSFKVTQMGTALGMRRVTALGDFTPLITGGRTEGLLQDVSAATDLLSTALAYEAELVTLQLQIGVLSVAFPEIRHSAGHPP